MILFSARRKEFIFHSDKREVEGFSVQCSGFRFYSRFFFLLTPWNPTHLRMRERPLKPSLSLLSPRQPDSSLEHSVRSPSRPGNFTRLPLRCNTLILHKSLIFYVNCAINPSGMHIDIVSQYNDLDKRRNQPRRPRRTQRDVIFDCRLQIDIFLVLISRNLQSQIKNLKLSLWSSCPLWWKPKSD